MVFVLHNRRCSAAVKHKSNTREYNVHRRNSEHCVSKHAISVRRLAAGRRPSVTSAYYSRRRCSSQRVTRPRSAVRQQACSQVHLPPLDLSLVLSFRQLAIDTADEQTAMNGHVGTSNGLVNGVDTSGQAGYGDESIPSTSTGGTADANGYSQ